MGPGVCSRVGMGAGQRAQASLKIPLLAVWPSSGHQALTTQGVYPTPPTPSSLQPAQGLPVCSPHDLAVHTCLCDWVVFVTVCMTKCALEYIDLRVTGSVQVGLGGWEYFSACLSLLIGVSFCMTVCDSINLTYPR